MSQNRIEQLIEEMYEYIEGCKPKGFSATQVVVMKEEIYDILDEMKLKIPEEIKRCAKVVANKDQIIASAEERAEKIIADAKRQAEMLVQESEIMRQAYLQANEMVSRATQQADSIFQQASNDAETISMGALRYTNDMLSEVERVIAYTYEEAKAKTEAMLTTLEENLKIVQENRRELNEEVAPQEAPAAAQESKQERHGDDDDLYEFDADAFLDNID